MTIQVHRGMPLSGTSTLESIGWRDNDSDLIANISASIGHDERYHDCASGIPS